MKKGDLVRFLKPDPPYCQNFGVIISIDDSHRQKFVNVMTHQGDIVPYWVNHVEVISESR